MTLTKTTEFLTACGGLNFATLGRTSSTSTYATWYGELEEDDLIIIMTVCAYPISQCYGVDIKKIKRKYCFSISLGDYEIQARNTGVIVTPLYIHAPVQDDILHDEHLIHKLAKKLRWNLPVDYVDYII